MSPQKPSPICPQCGSDNVRISKKGSPWTVFFLLLAALPLPIFKKEWYCFECRLNFKPETRTLN